MLSDAQRENLSVLFAALDAGDDGRITLDDALARADQVCAGFSLDEASPAHRGIQAAYRQCWEELVRIADADADGAIDLEEYLAAIDRGMLEGPAYLERSTFVITRAVFDGADADGDGMVDVEEYVRMITVVDPAREAVARAGFELIDADCDGLIARAELVAALRAALSGGQVPDALGGSVVR